MYEYVCNDAGDASEVILILFGLKGLDEVPSTSASVAKPKSSEPAVRRSAPLESFSVSRLKRKMRDEEEDPTCAAATLRMLRQKHHLSSLKRCAPTLYRFIYDIHITVDYNVSALPFSFYYQ